MDIKNCEFKFKCTMTWDTLIETSDKSVKYCFDCDRGVHYCNNQQELETALKKDWCVAIDMIDKDMEIHQTVGEIMPNYQVD